MWDIRIQANVHQGKTVDFAGLLGIDSGEIECPPVIRAHDFDHIWILNAQDFRKPLRECPLVAGFLGF